MLDMVETRLPHGIEAACQDYAPPLRQRVLRALETVLGGRRTMDGSRLTGDGFPLELAFVTGTDEARWTADPWDSDEVISPLMAANGALLRLGANTAMIDALAELGLGSNFAWIGGRHAANDSYKLYLDIPEGAALGALQELLALPAPDLVHPAKPRMAAISVPIGKSEWSEWSERGEIYYRTAIFARQLRALLSPCGHGDAAQMLEERIASEWGHALHDRLPGGMIGISYAASQGGISPTIYLFARALWGGDAATRRRWLAREDVTDPAKRAYAAASAGMAERHSCRTRHAMVGFHLAGQNIRLSLGLRPEAGL